VGGLADGKIGVPKGRERGFADGKISVTPRKYAFFAFSLIPSPASGRGTFKS